MQERNLGGTRQKQQNETEPIPQTNEKRKHRENRIHRRKTKTQQALRNEEGRRERKRADQIAEIQNETEIWRYIKKERGR